MIKLYKPILAGFALICALNAAAVPAKRDARTVLQPDGTQLTVRLVGDERSHFLLTSDNCLVKEENGTYYFANIEADGSIVSTRVEAADPSKRTQAQKLAAYRIDESRMAEVSAIKRAQRPRRYDAVKNYASSGTLPQLGMGRFTCNFPATGDIKAIVILVQYTDVKFTTSKPFDYFNDMLNKDGFSQYGGTGCAAEYFRLQSDNKFRPQFDVYGPVTLANNRAYYGKNDTSGNDLRPEEMIVEAVKALDSEVDFSQYDMDKDGVVDNVFVFYAGQGEASYGPENSVWPHAWSLTEAGKSFRVDGVKIDSYGCTNEYEQSRPDGVGTFIHEFSHVIGLPDLYDTVSTTNYNTPGEWSVMDYGPYNNNGCTPPNYSAYEINAMGWVEAEPITGPENVKLENLADNKHFRIINTENTNEFFLIENRQQKGWDKYLPSHGMLVWHIDYKTSVFDANEVNNTKSHMRVRIVKANNVESGKNYTDVQGWVYPGSSYNTSLTSSTTPALRSWAKKDINLPITDIDETDGLISFFVSGGVAAIEAPKALVPDEYGKDWFVAKWEPVEGAEDYLLTVMETEEGTGVEKYTCNMGTGSKVSLSDGWTSSATDTYTTSGNFGSASPSYKMASTGTWLRSPEFGSDVKEISFWAKGQGTNGSSYLTVSGVLKDGSEVLIDNIYPEANKAKTYTLDNLPSGVRQVIFTYNKAQGNLALDDVVIVAGGSSTKVLEGYNELSTEGATSKTVTGLDKEKKYSYTVKAVSGKDVSRESNIIEIDMPLVTGVVSVSEVGLSVNGRTLSSDEPVTIYDLSGSALANEVKSFTFSSPGIYIVRSLGNVLRIFVR